jgi:SPP1 gp7 family putative phage head morphogenesis protein
VFFVDIYNSLGVQLGDKNRTFNKEELKIFDMFISQNLLNISSLLTDERKNIGRVINEGIANGHSNNNISLNIQKEVSGLKHRAETIAITETANANSQFAREKMKQYNIRVGGWSSAKDKRVRMCHLKRNGQRFDLSKGCYSECDGRYLQTGQEIRCRCAFWISF